MAVLKLYRDKLRNNFHFLDQLFDKEGVSWGIVTKLLCGNEDFLREIINLGVEEIHDSRVSNLERVKEMNPDIHTMYIKPPPKGTIEKVVEVADISLNTEYETIKMLSDEAVRQKKLHRIIIMIEMGDLREGVMREDLLDFYSNVFQLPGISVVGLGTNLNCLHGVMPSQDKLVQLSLYKQLIEMKFNRKIQFISGGASVTIPLLLNQQLPDAVNHFRVGETIYFGNNLFTDTPIDGMETDVLELFTEIIEVSEKPKVPSGEMGEDPSGETHEINEADYGQNHYRGIIDIGLLDIDPKFLIPRDKGLSIIGSSSDMLVVELGENRAGYKVGDVIPFELKYMGALSILNSDYIDKVVE